MVATTPRTVAVRVLAAAAAVGPLYLVAGVPGAALGGGTVLALLLAPAFGFAAGQLGLVVVLPPSAPLLRVGLAQAGLFVALFGATATARTSVADAVAYGVLAGVLGGLTWWGIRTGLPLWGVAAGLIGAVALVGYGVHRSELVALGLVEESA